MALGKRRWTDKDPAKQRAVNPKRRRTQSERGKQLSRLRSDHTERSFEVDPDFRARG